MAYGITMYPPQNESQAQVKCKDANCEQHNVEAVQRWYHHHTVHPVRVPLWLVAEQDIGNLDEPDSLQAHEHGARRREQDIVLVPDFRQHDNCRGSNCDDQDLVHQNFRGRPLEVESQQQSLDDECRCQRCLLAVRRQVGVHSRHVHNSCHHVREVHCCMLPVVDVPMVKCPVRIEHVCEADLAEPQLADYANETPKDLQHRLKRYLGQQWKLEPCL
mmetsp:Transcript_10178/g.30608  ORF Transcript_10178/g.30608 Transcript_10178/m.30608 type:complete len:217 (-) Transcript_10178:545-1195(-)